MNKESLQLALAIGVGAGLTKQDVWFGVAAAVGTVVITAVVESGWLETAVPAGAHRFQSTVRFVWSVLQNWRSGRKGTDVPIHRYDFLAGRSEAGNSPIILNLRTAGHMIALGLTRFGKTALIWSILYELLRNHTPDELQLAVSSDKNTFQPLGKIPHLFCPVAQGQEETVQLLQRVKGEMERRVDLFARYANNFICDDIDKYESHSGERLPWIVVVLDETADTIAGDSTAVKLISTIAKQGLGYGITLVIGTQRPTRMGLPHEAQSQIATLFCTYMKNATEYGSVTKIPPEVYGRMTPTKGRFIAFSPELANQFWQEFEGLNGWGYMRSVYYEPGELEMLINRLGSSRAAWRWEQADVVRDTTVVPQKPRWTSLGSKEAKMQAVHELAQRLGHVPTAVELREHYEMARKTSETAMRDYHAWQNE